MELAASGLSEEEILAKAQLLMKAFGKEDAGSTAEYKLLSKQKNKALVKAEIPPKDFTAVSCSVILVISFVLLLSERVIDGCVFFCVLTFKLLPLLRNLWIQRGIEIICSLMEFCPNC